MSWLLARHVANSIVLGGAAIAASYIIGRAIRSAYRFTKRLELIHTTILQELVPNGGTSIKDQIGRIDDRVQRLEAVAFPTDRA